MKLSFTLSILLLALTASAQTDWWCVQPNARHYFKNQKGYVRGMRVDSVKTTSQSSVVFPFHTPRGSYQNNKPLDTLGGSWLGKTVTVYNDGIHHIENHWGDTVIIKAAAVLNESWMLFDDTTQEYYTATVTGVDTMTVLGNVDSIKEITITAYSNASINTADLLHNTKLILSKTNGLVQAVDLYMFPLHEPGEPYQPGFDYFTDWSTDPNGSNFLFQLFALHNPDVLEIYDYNIGDVFQHSIHNPIYAGFTILSKVVDEIDGKQVSGGQVVYSVRRWTEFTHVSGSSVMLHGTIPSFTTLTYSSAKLIDTTLMPEEWKQQQVIYFKPGDNNYWCKGPLYELYKNWRLQPDGTVHTLETCLYSHLYVPGLGLVQQDDCYVGPNMGYKDELIYFKKGSLQCGTYIPLGVGDAAMPQQFSIYPNPATDRLYINCPNTNGGATTINIFNQLGVIVKQLQATETRIALPVSDLAPGMYLLDISQQGETFHSKLLIAR